MWYEQYFGFKPTSTYSIRKYAESKRIYKTLTYLDRIQRAPSELFTEDIIDVFKTILCLWNGIDDIWEKTL